MGAGAAAGGDIIHQNNNAPKIPGCSNDFILVRPPLPPPGLSRVSAGPSPWVYNLCAPHRAPGFEGLIQSRIARSSDQRTVGRRRIGNRRRRATSPARKHTPRPHAPLHPAVQGVLRGPAARPRRERQGASAVRPSLGCSSWRTLCPGSQHNRLFAHSELALLLQG
ncbi:uncharacterized protein LOC119272063 [Triticum dicoccoides]|uniref:uncharacterized protein LOC119272063 n=1 Tax=Triticum dicoccoides TaxID=85692 RepID=UPI00189073CE|nr:uncharacterized protein LOC119272063 [Triticum dicoccoides]